MYDTIIIGAGMSGLAAGIRLAHYDRRVCILERHSAVGGLNSFFGRRGRTYDVGLHAVTNYTPRGTRQGPLARLLRQLRLAWDEFSLVAAGGLGDHVSRRDDGVFQRLRAAGIRGGAALSRGSGQFPPPGGGADRLRPVRPSGGGAIGPRGRRQPDRRSRCWSRCSSARCSSTAVRGSTTWTSASSASSSARSSWRGWPVRWRACG